MAKEIKPVVAYAESFGKLDIRVGRVVDVALETRTHKPNSIIPVFHHSIWVRQHGDPQKHPYSNYVIEIPRHLFSTMGF